jgi:uncharacterized protein (TIGR02246 family)
LRVSTTLASSLPEPYKLPRTIACAADPEYLSGQRFRRAREVFMLKASISFCALTLVFVMTACNQTPATDVQAESQAIRDNEAAWVRDWQAKDVDKITSHYAPDAAVLITDLPVMKGTDAIKGGIGGMLKDPHISLTFSPTVVVIAKSGDMAYAQGIYSMTYTEPKTGAVLLEKGKYVTVYQKQADGTWKAEEDIANADSPAKPAQT